MPENTPAGRTAAFIRGQMAANRRTGRELAEVLEIGATAASRRLHGETPFSIDELGTVADWLGLDAAEVSAAVYGHKMPRVPALH